MNGHQSAPDLRLDGSAATAAATTGHADPARSGTSVPGSGVTRQRAPWRAVAVPTEHGGWGLTLEPGLLGLLLAPAASSLWLALAAMVAFVARTPLKVVAVDLRRDRILPRTRLAATIGLVELALLSALVALAAATASASFWWPLLVAAPLVAVQATYEVRSRGRRLVPEVAGSVGVCAVVAMSVLADGGAATLAIGAWLVLAGRAVSSVPWVRGQIGRIHGREPNLRTLLGTDAAALAAALVAGALEPELWAGAAGVAVVLALQRSTARGEPVRPAIQGVLQMAMGFGLVGLTALGVALG